MITACRVSPELADWQVRAIRDRLGENPGPEAGPFTLALDQETGRAWMKDE